MKRFISVEAMNEAIGSSGLRYLVDRTKHDLIMASGANNVCSGVISTFLNVREGRYTISLAWNSAMWTGRDSSRELADLNKWARIKNFFRKRLGAITPFFRAGIER